MDPVLFQRFHPEEYYRSVLADGVRSDGRKFQERRKLLLQQKAVGSAHGSASIRIGQSAAIAGVRAEVTEATPDVPASGHIAVSVELPALCSSTFREKNRSLGQSTFLSNAISEIFNSARVFDPAQLTIRTGELCWVLHATVICISYDGNLFDLCTMAVLSALEDTQLPALAEESSKADVSSRLVVVPPGVAGTLVEKKHVKLLSRPLPVTFAQLPGEHWVLDPSAVEESLGSSVSLCLVGGHWLVYHQGGSTDSSRILAELMPAVRADVQQLVEVLDQEGD